MLNIVRIILFNIIAKEFNIKSGFVELTESLSIKFFIIVLFAPLIETVIFNFSILFALSKVFKNKYLIITLSSFLFGLMHYYSLAYVIFAFLGGLIYNSFFYICWQRYNILKAFIFTLLLHSVHNFTGFILIEVAGFG